MVGPFSLQLNESTDVSSSVQLIAMVRDVHNDVLRDEFLCCILYCMDMC